MEPLGKWEYLQTENSEKKMRYMVYKMIDSIKNQFSIVFHIYIKKFSENSEKSH